MEPNSWFRLVFGLMTPPKEGVFTSSGKNFAETLQFENRAVKNFFLFYYNEYFCVKNSELVSKTFSRSDEQKIQNILWKQVLVCSKGHPLSPSNTL